MEENITAQVKKLGMIVGVDYLAAITMGRGSELFPV